jgi:antitoxin component HigA of HigAB toxin-antitoxin module
MRARGDSNEGDRLDLLVTSVEAWETKRYPLELLDAAEAIKHHNRLHKRLGIPAESLIKAGEKRAAQAALENQPRGKFAIE